VSHYQINRFLELDDYEAGRMSPRVFYGGSEHRCAHDDRAGLPLQYTRTSYDGNFGYRKGNLANSGPSGIPRGDSNTTSSSR